MVGVALLGALFYGLVNSHFLGLIIGRALGPYSDVLAEHAFANPDPEVWRRIAIRHGVTIVVEPAGGVPVAFDEGGRMLPAAPPSPDGGEIRAVRTAEDGSRVTLYWTLWSLQKNHFALLAGLVVMALMVVGSGFWFLHRQLKPLAGLRAGVDAVARGEFAARVPVVRDDEIGQVASAFNEMAGRVGAMVDDRERLLADVSHELRSPIARMKVALEFMPEGDKRDVLARDLREMEQLITALLEREALRSRGCRFDADPVDLADIAAGVVATFAGRRPRVELVAGGAAPVRADPALMKLLIRNLVDNAIKFSRQDSEPVRVETEAANGRVVLRVADDGIGIPQGCEARLFEPFVKLDPSRGHHGGYGIGLSLCRRIVELHGGTIRLLPREPRGTEAVVTLGR